MSEANPPALTKSDRNSILLHGLAVFALTSVLAAAAAAKVFTSAAGAYAPSNAVSVPYFLAIFLLATVGILVALRFSKGGRVIEVMFALAMLSGAWFVADIFLPEGAALLVGSGVLLARYVWKNVGVANSTMAVGIAGVAAAIASEFTPNAMLVVLTILAFYDIVAVYATKHMVKMFRELAATGTLAAFALTPLRGAELARPVAGAGASGRALFLGTGDVALPVMLAVAAARVSPVRGAAVVLGSMAGFALMFALFSGQERRKPMPALPPIALGAILAYLIASLITPA